MSISTNSNGVNQSGSSSIPAIERLTGRENWSSWKFAAKTFLQLEGLWVAVKPKQEADGTFEQVDEQKDLRARLKLILLIDPLLYVHIEDAESAKEAWDKLETAFEDKGLSRQIGLLHKLIKSDLDSCGSMEEYVNQVISTAHQLNGIGFKLPDLWVGMILLAGLPDEYRPMIMALENSGVAITGDYVKTKLLQEQPLQSSSKKNSQAFATNKRHEKTTKQIKQPTSAKGPKCRKCARYGHIARDCKDTRKGETFCTVLSTFGKDAKDWIFDSAAYAHMTSNRELLTNLEKAQGKVVAANGGTMDIVACGTAKLQPVCRKRQDNIAVDDVQLIPGLTANLLSISRIVQKGYSVTFNDDGCKVFNPKNELVATGSHSDNRFKLEQLVSTDQVLSCNATGSLDLWHKRMGHLGVGNLKKLIDGLVTGITLNTEASPADCRVCPMGKQSKLPFPKDGFRASEVLQLVHSDISGPMEMNSIGGNRYYITFIDDKTRRIFVYFLKTKSEVEVLETFKNFHVLAERQSGKKLKVIRTDNGKEYTNKSFEGYLVKQGIRHETTNDYTPEQNGLAERANRTIVEKARCLLFESGLSKGFWAEAVSTAVYLINRSPTRCHDLTPEEAWSGRKPNLSHVRVFGTRAMVQVPKQKRRKWDSKSHECVLTGFDEETKGYRLYDLMKKVTIKSREVIFLNEGVSYEETGVKARQVKPSFVRLDIDDSIEDVLEPAILIGSTDSPCDTEDEIQEDYSRDDSDTSTSTLTDLVLPPRPTSEPPRSKVLRRSGREHVFPGKYKDFYVDSTRFPGISLSQPISQKDSSDFHGFADDDGIDDDDNGGLVAVASGIDCEFGDDPVTHQEALARDDGDAWKRAMQDEFDALMKNNTWTLTTLPRGRKAIKCKWVYKTKRNAEGDIQRHKARLVIKGYSQRKGVDYDETYAPVVRYSSLRYLFALAVKYDLTVDQMDAVTAFLQGDLDEDIYMEQPPCFTDENRRTMVCKLNKALYGLKQSSRVWNHKLDAALRRFGLLSTQYDPCVYVGISDGKIMVVAIYVDDLMIFTNDSTRKNKLKQYLSSCFQMKDLGQAQHCLGIRIGRTNDTITLDQEAYIETILKRFNMEQCKPVKVPMNPSEKLSKDANQNDNKEAAVMKDVPYQEAVGCLMYLAQSTRPDILFAVNALSRFNNNPDLMHWKAVKHVFRYLRGTSKLKLIYRKHADSGVVGYCDADWGSDTDDRKSTSGNVFMAQGGAISWTCKKQPTVALSSCEAEYMSVSAAVQEACWWRGLLTVFEQNNDEAIEIRCDNQSCIAVAKNGGYNPRTKHIDIRHHFIKDTLSRGIVNLTYVGTEEQIADGLTKPLQRMKFERCRKMMGLSAA